MRNAPSNSDNLIDSRDIIKRFDELHSELEDRETAVTEAEDAINDAKGNTVAHEETQANEEAAATLLEQLERAQAALEDWQESTEGDDYGALKKLIEQCEGYGDWSHGETLIADHYFETYAQQLADEIGAVDKQAAWPMTCIDWEQAADELKADYTEVDYDGHTYWVRS